MIGLRFYGRLKKCTFIFAIFMNVEFRSVVHFCYLLQKGPDEIHSLMVQAYGPESPSLSFVKKWVIQFKAGRTEVNDLKRPGRPPCEEYIDQISSYIKDYPFSSARSISFATGISLPTVITILKEKLHLVKKHAKWIPHILTDEQIFQRVEDSKKLYHFLATADPEKKLKIITCDESWFYLNYFTKNAWLPDGSEFEIPKRMISDQKIMIFTAFSTAGIILIEMVPPHTSFNSAFMCDIILPKLHQAAHEIQGVRANAKLFIHFDNAKPHVSLKTSNKMKQLHMEKVENPVYSPDVSPNDFFLYGFIKEKLKGRIHSTFEDLFNSVVEIATKIDKTTWENVYDDWLNRLQTVIDRDGQYI